MEGNQMKMHEALNDIVGIAKIALKECFSKWAQMPYEEGGEK